MFLAVIEHCPDTLLCEFNSGHHRRDARVPNEWNNGTYVMIQLAPTPIDGDRAVIPVALQKMRTSLSSLDPTRVQVPYLIDTCR